MPTTPATPLRSVNTVDSNLPKMIGTRSTASNVNEYILLHGPIYVPKSSIQFTMNSHKPSVDRDPTNYSFLHDMADTIKHDISFSSNYEKKVDMLNTNIPELESAIFREPPKFMSMCQRSEDHEIATTPTFSCEKVYENFEYDVTPQKERMDEYYVDSKDATTSIAKLDNAEIEEKASIMDNLLNVDLNLDFLKTFQMSEETMTNNDTLLLGDDYKLDTDHESALPYPISLFYPSISTQTCLEDSRSSVSTIIIPKIREKKLSAATLPVVVQEIKPPEEHVEKSEPEIVRPKRESLTEIESKKGWSIMEMLKEPKEEIVQKTIEEPRERMSVNNKVPIKF